MVKRVVPSTQPKMEDLSLPPPALGPDGEADKKEGEDKGDKKEAAAEEKEKEMIEKGLEFSGEVRSYSITAVVSFVEGRSASGCDDGHLVLHAKVSKGYGRRKDLQWEAPSEENGKITRAD